MKKSHSSWKRAKAPARLSAIALSAFISSPLMAQGVYQGTSPDLTPHSSTRGATFPGVLLSGETTDNSVVQRIIDNSNSYFQTAESNFKDGDFERARRDYDRALDSILEAGVDVRTDPRLHQHYRRLVDQIFQRQMTLMAMSPSTAPHTVAAAGAGDSTAGRGFGTQSYSPSPLDELANLDLTEDETRDVTREQVQTAVAAARLDFNFRPNALIQSFINYYQGRGRGTMENGLRRAGRFLTLSRKIFKEEGVPQDLVWLGQVESAWSPIARSWAAAVGLWQFVPSTGLRFGLNQDEWIDERSSFEKATRASARYLRFLADRYDGNWELAMAAYNSGEGRIDGAIAKSGYADFWEIYSRGLIPRETRNYVPNILATIIIAKNPERYGFSVKPEPPLTYDFVRVNNLVDLRLVADATDTPHALVEAINPELKRGVTPPGTEYLLRVPAGKGKDLHAALTRIPAEKRSSWRMLTAQTGDTFDSIARRTGISADVIEQVNGGVIDQGRKVVVPFGSNVRNVVLTNSRPDRRLDSESAAPENDENESNEDSAVTRPVKSRSVATGGAGKNQARQISYRVRRGETLGDIAGRYNTSVGTLMRLNGLGRRSRLHIGQELKVPVR
jgi:membrane-bound lytic murein transglycosylase D